jgi:hypothetical protein
MYIHQQTLCRHFIHKETSIKSCKIKHPALKPPIIKVL